MYRVKTMEEFKKDMLDEDSPVKLSVSNIIRIDDKDCTYFVVDKMQWLCGVTLPDYDPELGYSVCSPSRGEEYWDIAPFMVTTAPYPGRLHRRLGVPRVDDLEHIIHTIRSKPNMQ